jgi:hypothetical protein
MEPTMPLRLQEVYGYTSLQVGLIFMAADVPTLFGASLDLAFDDKRAALTSQSQHHLCRAGCPTVSVGESNGRVSFPFCYRFRGGS